MDVRKSAIQKVKLKDKVKVGPEEKEESNVQDKDNSRI